MYIRGTLSIIALCAIVLGCGSVDDSLPSISPLNPADRATLDDEDSYLRWSSAEAATRYHVQLSNSVDFTGSHLIDIKDLTSPVTPITSYRFGEVYYWRVRYRTAENSWSAWNGPWKFATFFGAPALKSPTENGYIHDTRPQFAWSSIREAASYDIAIFEEGEPATSVYSEENITRNHTTIADHLEHSRIYSWRVRARYPEDITGAWSVTSSFAIVNAWKRSYGLYAEGLDHRTYTIKPLRDGMIVAGNIRIWNGTDVGLTILDANGSIERSFKLGLRPRDDIASISVSDDTIITVMTTSTVERDDRNPWIVNLDETGMPRWQLFLRSPGDQTATDVVTGPDGDIIISGTMAPEQLADDSSEGSVSQSRGNNAEKPDVEDGLVIRIQADGTAAWMKRYAGPGSDSFSAVSTDSGHFFIAGTTDSFDVEGKAIIVLKLDVDGEVIWANIYDGALDETVGGPDSLVICRDSSIRVAGSSSKPGRIGGSMVLMEIEADGELRSVIELSGENRSFATSVVESVYGDTILGGNVMADSPIAGGLIRTPKVIRLDSDGNIVWQRGTWGAYPQTVESVYARSDGCIIAAGWWYEFNLDASWMMKIDTEGRYPPDPASIQLNAEAVTFDVRKVEFEITDIEYTPWAADGTVEASNVETRLIWP